MQGVRKAEEGADTVLLGRNQLARLIPGDAPEKFRGVWLLGWRPPTVRWTLADKALPTRHGATVRSNPLRAKPASYVLRVRHVGTALRLSLGVERSA
jgi:hypothetical protein